MVNNFFPFLTWFKEVKQSWKADAIAGLLVAVILIPQSLAYAQMAGMPPIYGLYASFLPVIVAGLWGSSRQLSTGPAVVVSLLTLTTISSIALVGSNEFVIFAAILALMVGLIQVFLGLAKLGNLVQFVSHPVIVGFVSAAAILIALLQLPKLLGFTTQTQQHIVLQLFNAVREPVYLDTTALIFGVMALLLILLGNRFFSKLPSILLVVFLATLLSKYLDYSGAVVGHVPAGLPVLAMPQINLKIVQTLFQSALVIAVVAYMASISIAKTLATQSRKYLNPNQELIGQGLANITASISGTSPVAGSFSRSAVNYTAGAKTNFSSVVTGIVIGLTLLFFTHFLFYIPQSVLAAVIVVSVLKLVDIKHIKQLWINYKYDGWVAVITFLATFMLTPHLDYGILIGIAFSILVYARRAHVPSVAVFKLDDQQMVSKKGLRVNEYKSNNLVLAVSSDHSLIFTNADKVRTAIETGLAQYPDTKYLLFFSRGIGFMDSTAIEMLENLVAELKDKDVTFLMVRVQPKLARFLKKLDLYHQVGLENIFVRTNDALKSVALREKR